MKKKRPITLLEIMIVIVLIGLIGGVVSYNLKGTLDKGKAFRSAEGAKKLADILNLEIQEGHAKVSELIGRTDERHEAVIKCITDSGLISSSEAGKFIKDGWGHYYTIVRREQGVDVYSVKLNEYQAQFRHDVKPDEEE